MPRLSQTRLKQILTKALSLKNPEYHLETWGGRINGSIISESFKGKRDHQRQFKIWDALEDALGKDSYKRVGMLLAYTPGEWTMGEDIVRVRLRKKAG